MIEFEWDEKKNKKNRLKHGIWFEEARQVFDDSHAIQFFDQEHSHNEDRFIMLGMTTSSRVLVVIYCERGDKNVIRIISAREATKKERGRYEKGI